MAIKIRLILSQADHPGVEEEVFCFDKGIGEDTRRVKKLMRPVDGSISINRPNVPDNKRIDPGTLMAPDSMEKAAHYPCLDDSVPHDNALHIRAVRALRRPHSIESALTKLPLSPTVPSARRRRSNSDLQHTVRYTELAPNRFDDFWDD